LVFFAAGEESEEEEEVVVVVFADKSANQVIQRLRALAPMPIGLKGRSTAWIAGHWGRHSAGVWSARARGGREKEEQPKRTRWRGRATRKAARASSWRTLLWLCVSP
jgi:hypothetical protein